jgi:heme exporter protein A
MMRRPRFASKIAGKFMRLVADSLSIDRGGRRILSNVSFRLDRGALSVTGPNGVGKSSLLRALAGFLAPAAGAVRLEGVGDPATAIHYVGHRDGLKPQLTARENLAFMARFLGARGPAALPAAALGALAVEALADLPVAWLSAGQRRRVALARLVVAPRPLWLLDEPLTGLDAASVERLEALAADHVAGGGLVVAATHAPLRIATGELRLSAIAHTPPTDFAARHSAARHSHDGAA